MNNEFQKKSKMITVDLQCKLQEKQCTENGDVKVHLAKLEALHKELIVIGTDTGDDTFIVILLGLLPTLYNLYLVALTATAALLT